MILYESANDCDDGFPSGIGGEEYVHVSVDEEHYQHGDK